MVVALGGAEVALRLWTSLATPQLYELCAPLGWRHVPGVDRMLEIEGGRRVRFTTDARGLRATPHGEAQGADRRRVLFVGDSFTQGSQVAAEELFTVLVERQADRVVCWNAGVGGYSTLQEWRALPEQLAAHAPDVVVLVVYDNDFADNLMPYFSGLGPRPYVRVHEGRVEIVDEPAVAAFERFLMPAPCAFWCYQHLALYRTLHKNLFLPARGVELAQLEERERAALSAADQRTAMAWLLERFVATVHAAKCGLLVAAIPTRDEATAGAAPSHAWLAARCEEAGVPFLSLLPALRDSERAYFAMDIHLTAQGHAAVANALRPFVEAALQRRN